MKSNIKFALILSFFALFIFSCQNEAIEENGQNQEETLAPNSPLANLIRSTASNDGTVDDIMDNASCFSVELPVTIIANGITVTIESVEDLAVLEDLFSEFDNDDDDLDFLFPITIILNDYEEIVIENEEQLEGFVEDCSDSQEEVIECVDFVYPISFSIYNTDFQVIDNVVVNNDEELHDFIENLNDDNDEVTLASLDFPVSLIYGDGSTVEVSNNEELEAAINAAEGLCDDEADQCEVEDVEMYLQECYWIVQSYNGDDHLQDFAFEFLEDGILNVINNDTTQYITGGWNMSVSNEGYSEIVISGLEDLQDMNGSWIVYECDEDELLIKQEIDGQMVVVEFAQECEDELDCTAQEIALNLKECKWWMGTDLLSPNYSGPLFFNEDGTVNIGYENGNQLTGTWDIVIGDAGIFLILDVPEDYEPIALEWRIVECDDDRLELIHDENELVLEQECETNNQSLLDCVEYYIYSQECDENNDGIATFVIETNLDQSQDCLDLYVIGSSMHPTYQDAQNGTNGLDIQLTTPTELESQTIYVRIWREETGEYAIQELELEVEPCDGLFECFEDFELEACADPSGEAIFNLSSETIGLIDCTVSYTPSFHYTLPDAENNVNAISDTENYISIDGIVYLRIEAENGNFEVYEIYLDAVDCDYFECYDDGILEVCDEAGVFDEIQAFNLNEVFGDCPQDNVEISFYELLMDAEAEVNQIANASSYTNVSNPQTIYARVQLEGTTTYEVFEVELIVEDCSGSDTCSEEVVDNILQECYWIPTSVAGDDNFNDFTFEFNDNQSFVVEGGGISGVGVWMTYGNEQNNPTTVEISQLEGNLQMFNGTWTVVECSETQMIFTLPNGSEMVLDRECE